MRDLQDQIRNKQMEEQKIQQQIIAENFRVNFGFKLMK
jgi:catalase